jgi:hypothetical protein
MRVNQAAHRAGAEGDVSGELRPVRGGSDGGERMSLNYWLIHFIFATQFVVSLHIRHLIIGVSTSLRFHY